MMTLKEFAEKNTLNEAFCSKADFDFALIVKMDTGNYWVYSKHTRIDLAQKAQKKAQKTGLFIYTEIVKR